MNPTTNLPIQIKTALEKVETEGKVLQPHQLRVIKYVSGQIPFRKALNVVGPRGVLINHGLGSGKTITLVGCMIVLERPVVLLAPKSLIDNFREQVVKFVGMGAQRELPMRNERRLGVDEIMSRVKSVALNAPNCYEQFKSVVNGSLEGLTLIVDEVHNLARMILSGGVNGPSIYHMIMRTLDLKVLFASGTFPSRLPEEGIPVFNMLSGVNLFPPVVEEFYSLFVGGRVPDIGNTDTGSVPLSLEAAQVVNPDSEKNNVVINSRDAAVPSGPPVGVPVEAIGGPPEAAVVVTAHMINKNVYQNRLFGLISYAEASMKNFPVEMPIEVIEVPMELEYQWPAYKLARIDEADEIRRISRKRKIETSSLKIPEPSSIGTSSRKIPSTYRKESRALCNVLIRGGEGGEKEVLISPKLDMMVKRIEGWAGGRGWDKIGKVLVYSQFRKRGVLALGKKLEEGGWKEFGIGDLEEKNIKKESKKNKEDEEDLVDDDIDGGDGFEMDESFNDLDILDDENEGWMGVDGGVDDDENIEFERRFMVLDGSVKSEDRTKLKNYFNSGENVRGKKCLVMLVTSTGVEGLNLLEVRSVLCMEPFWHYTRITQILRRGARYGSHMRLRESDRNIERVIYLSVSPSVVKREVTTDQELYALSIKRQIIIDEFILAGQEVAIDCVWTRGLSGCRICKPTNVALFSDSVSADVRGEDPCESYEEKEEEVSKIVVDEIEYYYSRKNMDARNSIYGVAVYVFRKDLNAFVRVRENSTVFSKVYTMVMREEGNEK